MAGKVFISYSHLDEVWKNRVVSQLKVLSGEGLEVWDDRRINAGDKWRAEIETALNACDVALLLISAEFLTSGFILKEEIPRLLQRREQEGIRLIPVILKPCQWTKLPWLNPTQARPTDGQPLSGMSEHDADDALSKLAGEIFDLLGPLHAQAAPAAACIDIDHLPSGAEQLFGRSAELQLLDAAWAEAGRTTLVELVAPGGVGKTSLVREWLDGLRADGWRGAKRVFGWSFYSQGSSDERQASEDPFLAAGLAFFRVKHDPALGPHEKGKLLATAVAAQRTLLILDGLEPLQYPPGGPLTGELKAPGVEAMLTHLANVGQPGLCLITTRERVQNLAACERNDQRPRGGLIRCDLSNLAPADGAHLLHQLGANRAGEAAISADDPELILASEEVRGHALTLSLLGRYLKLAHGGDIRRRDQVDFSEADAETLNGHAFKAMAAYRKWFEREGEPGARPLAVLRLLGFFDRPAAPASLAALRADPPIPSLTEALAGIKDAQWNIALNRLAECGLIFPPAAGVALDTHPLIREYFAKELRDHHQEAWHEGHRRLFEQLRNSVLQHPEGAVGLQPLYQAVVHGCLAGVHQEALDEVYVDRILRGTGKGGFYSSKKLGLIGTDLGAVAGFFAGDWSRPVVVLSEADQAWLLSVAAFSLRALGRLDEAREPMRAGAELAVKLEDRINAAIRYGNLSELELSLGQIVAAVDSARKSLDYAESSGDGFQRMGKITTLADAQHQQGEVEAARSLFVEAEKLQAERQPDYPLLYSQAGFRHCDLLLVEAEQAAWRVCLEQGGKDAGAACTAVELRAAQTLEWLKEENVDILSIALDHLTLARCALLRALLAGSDPAAATGPAELALKSLRDANTQGHIPRGLLTRAWLRHACGDQPGAEADLDEAEQIAARGGMKLHLADIALHRARLFRDRAALAEARRLIEECGYGRRLPELADAEAFLNGQTGLN